MNCTVSFKGVKDGVYTVGDLFNPKKRFTLKIVHGIGSFSVPLDRWDCRAFWSTMRSPNGTVH
jgi:hypothetical protein